MRHKDISMTVFAALALALAGCEASQTNSPPTEAIPGTAQTDCVSLVKIGDNVHAFAVCREAAESGDA